MPSFVIARLLKTYLWDSLLAKYRDKQCKASEAEIAQALTGSYRDEHLFELKQAYEAWQFSLTPSSPCAQPLPSAKPCARPTACPWPSTCPSG